MNEELRLALQMLDEAFTRKTWHGPNLRGSIRGVTAGEASWRPGKGRHNIWEITLHAAYWKYAVRRRLRGEKRGSFAIEGSNWIVRPSSSSSWKADVSLLESEHRLLREAIEHLSVEALNAALPGGKVSVRSLLIGIAYHDVYHAGQIQLLKRMYRGRGKGG